MADLSAVHKNANNLLAHWHSGGERQGFGANAVAERESAQADVLHTRPRFEGIPDFADVCIFAFVFGRSCVHEAIPHAILHMLSCGQTCWIHLVMIYNPEIVSL
jgi:hypothetical protein